MEKPDCTEKIAFGVKVRQEMQIRKKQRGNDQQADKSKIRTSRHWMHAVLILFDSIDGVR